MTDNTTPDPLNDDATRILSRMRRLPTEADLTDEQRQTYVEYNQQLQRLARLLNSNATLSGSDMRRLTDYLMQVMEREAITVDQDHIPGLLVKVLVGAYTSPVVDTPEL